MSGNMLIEPLSDSIFAQLFLHDGDVLAIRGKCPSRQSLLAFGQNPSLLCPLKDHHRARIHTLGDLNCERYGRMLSRSTCQSQGSIINGMESDEFLFKLLTDEPSYHKFYPALSWCWRNGNLQADAGAPICPGCRFESVLYSRRSFRCVRGFAASRSKAHVDHHTSNHTDQCKHQQPNHC